MSTGGSVDIPKIYPRKGTFFLSLRMPKPRLDLYENAFYEVQREVENPGRDKSMNKTAQLPNYKGLVSRHRVATFNNTPSY